MIELLTSDLTSECLKLFGDPVRVEYCGASPDDEDHLMHWWIIHTRLFGRRARFDVEISNEVMDRSYAVHLLVSQLAFQIMDQHEENMLRGYTAYFDMDRKYTTGIVQLSGPYKIEKWRRPPIPVDENGRATNTLDFKVGPFKS